jgi:hypothetical protein
MDKQGNRHLEISAAEDGSFSHAEQSEAKIRSAVLDALEKQGVLSRQSDVTVRKLVDIFAFFGKINFVNS